jgi:hypothetical protein
MSINLHKQSSPTPDATASGKAEMYRHRGFYNETSVAIITFGMFSTVGYWLGKLFGRLGDQEVESYKKFHDNVEEILQAAAGNAEKASPSRMVEQINKLQHRASYGKGEAAWKWVFGLIIGGTAAAVALKNLREAQAESDQLAKRAAEMERTHEALTGRYVALPDQDKPIQVQLDMAPDARVRQVEAGGMVQAPETPRLAAL